MGFKSWRQKTRLHAGHGSSCAYDSSQSQRWQTINLELKSKMEIYVDGGVKSGCDIFKCLALGADFVFIGRGFMFSLVKGEEGISEAFDILSEELKRAMLVCGSSSIREINGEFLTRYPRMKL